MMGPTFPIHPPAQIPPTQQDWEAQRDRITKLYREDNLSLKDVMAIMERYHHFKVTQRMYKRRVQRWGLDKKFKEKEVKAVIYKKKQRDAIGKRSVFQIRGRVVDLEDLKRYLKRKHLSMDDIDTRALSPPGTPSGLVCMTPPDIPSSPRTPDTLALPEVILLNIRNYFTGSVESGTWVIKDESVGCISVKDSGDSMGNLGAFMADIHSACPLFISGRYIHARFFLNRALAKWRKIILSEHPLTLDQFFFSLYVVCHFYKNPEIIPYVHKHIAELAANLLPAMHPLVQIFAQFLLLDSGQQEAFLQVASREMRDQSVKMSGRHLDLFALELLLTESQRTSDDDHDHDLESAELKLRNLMSDWENAFGKYDVRSLRILFNLGAVVLHSKRYIELELIGREFLVRASSVSSQYLFDYCKSQGFFLIARALRYQGNLAGAVQMLQEAISWRPKGQSKLPLLVEKEQWLIELHDYDAAAEARQEYWNKISSTDGVLFV